MTIAPRESEQFWHQCVLIVILVIAACVRFYQLDYNSLSSDALINLAACEKHSWSSMVMDYHNRTGLTPLYPTLLCTITDWASSTEFFVRLLSALAGITAIYCLYITGRDFISPTAGLLAAAVVSSEFHIVLIDRSASIYSLFLLCSLIHNYCFLHLFFSGNGYQQQPLAFSYRGKSSDFQASWRPSFPAHGCCLLGFWISGALAFYSSPMALIQLSSEVLVSAFLIKKSADIFPNWRTAMRALWLPLLLALLPWLPMFYRYHGWVMDGHLFTITAAAPWRALQGLLPVGTGMLYLLMVLTVLLPVVVITLKLLKKHHTLALPLVYLVAFQFGFAALSLCLILPANQLSYFFYWWIFILLILMPLAIVIDTIPNPVLKKWVLGIAVLLIIINQIHVNARYNLYFLERGGNFRLSAEIIRADKDFMQSGRKIVMTTDLFRHHLKTNGVTAPNILVIDKKAAPEDMNTSKLAAGFYNLEHMGGDRKLKNDSLAFQTLSAKYKTVCITQIPWIRIVKFSIEAPTDDQVPDCQRNLANPTLLQ